MKIALMGPEVGCYVAHNL